MVCGGCCVNRPLSVETMDLYTICSDFGRASIGSAAGSDTDSEFSLLVDCVEACVDDSSAVNSGREETRLFFEGGGAFGIGNSLYTIWNVLAAW
jgi:hypothetical protein